MGQASSAESAQHFQRKKKRAPFGARSRFGSERFLDCLDVHRLQAFVALLDVELNTLSLGQ